MNITNECDNNQELLRLENISFRYESGEQALLGVSLSINKGEKIAVLGNNGAGKSTFFLCCNGVLNPNSGKLFYKKNEIKRDKKSLNILRKNVGLVFQDPDNQIIAATVESEVSFGPINLGLTRQQVCSRIDYAISKLELDAMRHRPPHYLSGGEKKRVCIADILAMQPEIMLFDEPTASLDPLSAKELEATINEMCEDGVSVVVSTHDVDFAWRWATRIIVFCNSKIIADTSPEKIFCDETLLNNASLKKPQIYELAEITCNVKGKQPPAELPKNFDEFKNMLRKIL